MIKMCCHKKNDTFHLKGLGVLPAISKAECLSLSDEMAQWTKVFATKPDDMTSRPLPRDLLVERESQFLQTVL